MKLGQEFLDAYYKRIEQEGEHPTVVYSEPIERALWNGLTYLFKKDGLPEIPSAPEGLYWFHKVFRIADITESGYLDMVFWQLIKGAVLFDQVLLEYAKTHPDPIESQ